MSRPEVALGADAERARIRAADRDGVAWRRWAPVSVAGSVLAVRDHDSGLQATIELVDGTASLARGTARDLVGTPTASFLQTSAGEVVVVQATAAKRSPEDVVLRVDVTNTGLVTTSVSVTVRLAFQPIASGPDAEPGTQPADRPVVRAPWEAHDHDLPPDTSLLWACHPALGTWWLTGTADGLAMDALDDDTSATLRVPLTLAPDASRSLRFRLCRGDAPRSSGDLDAAATLGTRAREAAAFAGTLLPATASDAAVRASLASLAGLLWAPAPDATATDRILGAVGLAVADPVAAQGQLSELLGSAAGQTEASAGPPLMPWAILRLHELTTATGRRDHPSLEASFHALLDDYSRWVDRLDTADRNPLQGGILGLDGSSDTAEGTAWMACYTLWMLSLAVELARDDEAYQDVAVTFLDSALAMIAALDDLGGSGLGLWDEADGRYRDVARGTDGAVRRAAGTPVVGLLPLLAVAIIPRAALAHLPDVAVRLGWSLRHEADPAGSIVRAPRRGGAAGDVLIAVASAERRASALHDAAAWMGDVPPVIACLLIDVLDRLDSFDLDLGADLDVQAALLARLHDDLRGPAWANLLAGAMRRSR